MDKFKLKTKILIILNNYLYYIIFILIITGVFVISDYRSYDAYVWLLGICFIIPKYFYNKRKEYLFYKKKNRLIKIGDKVEINLKRIKIKEHAYGLNITTSKIINLKKNFKLITFDIKYKDKHLKYDVYIDKDIESIKINCRYQQKTTLYVNPLDCSDNYLDLSFLNLNRKYL